MNSFDMYSSKEIQDAIKSQVKRIRGIENREDATQEAYHAIIDEGPITIEDAIACVTRAIERYRWHVRREAKMDAEGWISNKSRRDNVSERDTEDWGDFASRYLGIDNDDYVDDGEYTSLADTRNYETADFVVRPKAFR